MTQQEQNEENKIRKGKLLIASIGSSLLIGVMVMFANVNIGIIVFIIGYLFSGYLYDKNFYAK
jgi:hypothetical protein